MRRQQADCSISRHEFGGDTGQAGGAEISDVHGFDRNTAEHGNAEVVVPRLDTLVGKSRHRVVEKSLPLGTHFDEGHDIGIMLGEQAGEFSKVAVGAVHVPDEQPHRRRAAGGH